MPSLNPNTNFELVLIERKQQLINPFELDWAEKTCQRVLAFLANIQNKFGNILESQKKDGEEFFLTMPTIAAFESAIYLFEAIASHAKEEIADSDLKQFLVKFVEAHTIIWSNGVPSAKVGLYGNWTRKTELYQITLIEDGKLTNDKAIINDLQSVIIEKLWQLKKPNNKIKAVKL